MAFHSLVETRETVSPIKSSFSFIFASKVGGNINGLGIPATGISGSPFQNLDFEVSTQTYFVYYTKLFHVHAW